MELYSAFAAGWFFGSALLWFYFVKVRLIRTRREWYADRIRRGLSAPPDWDKDDE